MRKTTQILLATGFAALATFSSCKKATNENNLTPPANTTPAYVPPQPGSLVTSNSSLVLQVNTSTTVGAVIYNADGTYSPNPPSIIWQSNNTAIATVSNGTINAVAEGVTSVTVTDGIHGVLVVNVQVIGATVALPTKPTHVLWTFNANVLAMKPNTSQPLGNFVVFTAAGQAVQNPVLTFMPPAASGLSFNSNNVSSGATTGSFDVLVKIGNDTLENPLRVLVNSDTAYSFEVVYGTWPLVFHSNNLTAQTPVMIAVTKCWYAGNVPVFDHYVTSPEKIQFVDQEGSVALNAEGKLTSIKVTDLQCYQGAVADITYKNVTIRRFAWVYRNLSGNYGITQNNSNHDSYNYCITQSGPDIFYTNGNTYFIYGSINDEFRSQKIDGTYYIKINNTQVFKGNDNAFHGYYDVKWNMIYTGTGNTETIELPQGKFTHVGDYTSSGIAVSSMPQGIYMQKDAGNCTPPNNGGGGGGGACSADSLALLQMLTSGSATWVPSSCEKCEIGITSFTFNPNGTGTFTDPSPTQSGISHTFQMAWAMHSSNDGSCSFIIEYYNTDTYTDSYGTVAVGDAGDIITVKTPYSGNTLYDPINYAGLGSTCNCPANQHYFTKQ